MIYSRMNRLHSQMKKTHFRAWKSGKIWLYGAVTLTVLGLGVAVPTTFFGTSTTLVAHADTTSAQNATITFWPSTAYTGQKLYAYVWGTGNTAYDSQFVPLSIGSAVGSADSVTLSNLSASSMGIIITTTNNWSTAQKLNAGGADIMVSMTAGHSVQIGINQQGTRYATSVVPTISAPTNAPTSGIVGTPVTLNGANAVITDSSKMGSGAISSVTVTDPNGVTTPASADTFTPKIPGQYTLTYNYSYTNLDKTTSTVSANSTIQVTAENANKVTTTSGPDLTQGQAIDLSANGNTMKSHVSDSNSSVTPSIQSVSWTPTGSTTAQTITANADGTYTFPSAGTYTVIYTDGTGATGTVDGKVLAQPARFTTVTDADTKIAVGNTVDAENYYRLIDPNNSAINISNATISVTGPDSSDFTGAAISGTQFIPDVEGDYTINYSYVDGTGAEQKASQIITVVGGPKLNADESFEAQKTVNADGTGIYTYNPQTQGVTVTDPENDKALPSVTIYDVDGKTPLTANPDGTYNLTPAGTADETGSTSGTYYVTWAYPGAEQPSWDMQTVTVLSAGQVQPVITVPAQSNVNVGSTVDTTQGLTMKNSANENLRTDEIKTALANGDLTISLTDPSGNNSTLRDGIFSATDIGNYGITFDYTDPVTGLSAVEQSGVVVSQPATNTETDIISNGSTTYTYSPNSGNVTLTGGNSANLTTVNQITDSKGIPYGTVDENDGVSSADLPIGSYTVQWQYTYTDVNGNVVSIPVSQTVNVIGKVTYDANGGTGMMASQKTDTNGNITLDTNSYTNGDKTFKGWNTKADGSGISYTDKQAITGISSNVTLYAQWIGTSGNTTNPKDGTGSGNTTTLDPTDPATDKTYHDQLNKTVTQTINYVYGEKDDGKKASDSNVQEVQFTRTATYDNVTKQIVAYGPWTPVGDGNFKAVDSPIIKGYHTKTPTVTGSTADPNADSAPITVHYDTTTQHVIITYIDQNTGKILKTQKLTGKTDAVLNYDVEAMIAEYLKQGYLLVSNNVPEVGKMGRFKVNADGNGYEVHLSLAPKTKKLSSNVTKKQKVDTDNGQRKLPATGERVNHLGVIGLVVMAMTSLFALDARKRG
ncbi:KxYKxGKxW signal peptide domain-containing protein [Lacticaseibacillus sp. 53-4]|uniref:mucin-binding protein n=1 Tax=Lacticaseibacillus sp. 53-4 TaxID=2799575 RepID=UPI001944C6EA|nr:KxYKxGKxW signal peptide domain-containing protein [Lacticaseibacillus sp. 53-4]